MFALRPLLGLQDAVLHCKVLCLVYILDFVLFVGPYVMTAVSAKIKKREPYELPDKKRVQASIIRRAISDVSFVATFIILTIIKIRF